jgi:UDP-glucose 4-epimerase
MSGSPTQSAEPASDAPCDVLVIGGAGFIGSHLVERLVTDRVALDVADDLSTGTLANLAEARNAARRQGSVLRINTIDAGSSELGDLVALRRPRQIVHLATLVPGTTSPPELGRSFTSTLAVLEAARACSVEKVVVLLPANVMYGSPAARDLPAKEGDIVPRGLRGVVAKALVDLLVDYREHHGIEFSALAASSVYGSRQRPGCGAVANLMAAAARREPALLTGDGRQTRDFVYVDDVVDALARARHRGSGLVVNIGTGVQTTLRDLAAMVGEGGPEPSYVTARDDELTRFAISPVRARIHLGWAPWTTLSAGIEQSRPPT